MRLVFLFIGLFLSACALKLKEQKEVFEGVPKASSVTVWETKANIRDIKRNKINKVTIDTIGVKGDRLRLEASVTMGYPIGSLVMDQERFVAAVFPQKKFFKGILNERALARTFNIPIPATALFSIAFNEPIKLPNWNCQLNGARLPISCEGPTAKIEWEYKSEGAKLIRVSSAEVEVAWAFKAPINKPYGSDMFTLDVPNGYQVLEIN